jgi:hypothetical protein
VLPDTLAIDGLLFHNPVMEESATIRRLTIQFASRRRKLKGDEWARRSC